MIIIILFAKFLAVGCFAKHIEGLLENQFSTTDGVLWRRYASLTPFQNKNEAVCELNFFGTMPKRVKSKSSQKSKKARHTVGSATGVRTPIPRNCKSITTPAKKKSILDIDFLSMPSSKSVMGANQAKQENSEKKEESGDELDVVYDLKEEKKNKIYEVITVMSDDETPNKITYERIYADDPESRVVDPSEALSSPNGVLNVNNIVDDLVKETALIKEKLDDPVSETDFLSPIDNPTSINIDTKSDSDNDVICVAVLDAKTKAENKKANVEEICLSSDSEPESYPKVPPLRLKVPFSTHPYINKYIRKDSCENSFGYGFRQDNYPYVYGNKNTKPLIEWNSYRSTSPRATSDEISLSSPTSPKFNASGDESSSSVLSNSSSSKSINSDNLSSSSSDDEDKSIFWKADRESRRKTELRYEECTDLGKKIHEGKFIVDEKSFTFKVMSYNVLAQYLLDHHMRLYMNHDRRALDWNRRWDLLYNEIKDENPEILCLQEVQHSHLISHYAKLLDLGYRWIYKKRTNNHHDGVAIFYKAGVFIDEENSTVEFYQPGVGALDRDNVGLVMRLRLKESPNNAIVIATTHLLYNPKRGDVKLAQMQVLLAEIDRLAFNKDARTYYPVILTGDFNLKPNHGVYKLITEGELKYEGMLRKTIDTPRDDSTSIMQRTLLPSRLGVTDRCQHANVVEARVKGEDADKTKLYHSEYNQDPKQDFSSKEDEKDDRFESGTLYHGFNFQSVYSHMQSGQKEATTHHDTWITVDYIFYSVPKVKESQTKEEGPLQLLSRLRLPTQDECDRFLRFLPNFAFGSDHLPLVGKFLLQLH